MHPIDKNQVTQYVLSKLMEWYNDVDEKGGPNDLSILKTLKLIFLLCTVNVDKDNQNLLDLCYDNFVAMPLGPVELSTYNFFSRSIFIDKKTLHFQNLEISDFEGKCIVDSCIEVLKHKNPRLITYTASQLVDLTHKYSCWIINYNKGISLREPIRNDEIKRDEKFYYI